eukprot:jgi/Hompol1/2952/HPOL_006245-RA
MAQARSNAPLQSFPQNISIPQQPYCRAAQSNPTKQTAAQPTMPSALATSNPELLRERLAFTAPEPQLQLQAGSGGFGADALKQGILFPLEAAIYNQTLAASGQPAFLFMRLNSMDLLDAQVWLQSYCVVRDPLPPNSAAPPPKAHMHARRQITDFPPPAGLLA